VDGLALVVFSRFDEDPATRTLRVRARWAFRPTAALKVGNGCAHTGDPAAALLCTVWLLRLWSPTRKRR
jgi:hypothetical protein